MRWNNYGLWMALGSLVVMLLNDALNVAPSVSEPYVDTVLAVLIAAGIVNNPKEGKGFTDRGGFK